MPPRCSPARRHRRSQCHGKTLGITTQHRDKIASVESKAQYLARRIVWHMSVSVFASEASSSPIGRPTRTVIECTIAAALGGLLFGFDTAVISGLTSALSATYALSPSSLGFTVAIALWGTIVGLQAGVMLATGLDGVTAYAG